MTYIPEVLRRLVTERAGGRCEYCRLHADDTFFTHEAHARRAGWTPRHLHERVSVELYVLLRRVAMEVDAAPVDGARVTALLRRIPLPGRPWRMRRQQRSRVASLGGV